MTPRARRFADSRDPQTSPVSSQATIPLPKSSFGDETGSWLVASNSSEHQEAELPIDPTKARIHLLPRHVKDRLLSFCTEEEKRKVWAVLSVEFALLARKHLLENIDFNYAGGKTLDIDGTRARSLLSLLQKANSNYVNYVRNLSITDKCVSIDTRMVEDLLAIETAKYDRSPGSFFHDEALATILRILTNLHEISFRFNGYKLDCHNYDQEYSGALAHVFQLPSLRSINFRGVLGLSLSNLKDLTCLKRLSLSAFALEEPNALEASADAERPLAIQSESTKPPTVKPLVINVSDIQGGLEFFDRFITHPNSYMDFSKLTLVNTELRSFDDIKLLGYLLGACSNTLEFLQMSTRTLYRAREDIQHPPEASLSPIVLSNLTSLTTLKIRLNFHSPIGIDGDEVTWFLDNIRSLPDENCLEDIELIMDTMNSPIRLRLLERDIDRDILRTFTGWQAMDATFVGRNMENLQRFTLIICCRDKSYDGSTLLDEIKLPRLKEKGPYSTQEDVDLRCTFVPHYGSFILL